MRESCETRESCPLSTSEPLQPPVVIPLLNPRGGHKGGDGLGGERHGGWVEGKLLGREAWHARGQSQRHHDTEEQPTLQ